jgi:hypothetical protein
MIRHRYWLALLLCIGASAASAGSACGARLATPTELAHAADVALRTRAALDEAGAPVALLSRVGTDLSEYGLAYSHIAFVRRDDSGRWSVVHLLNHCGSDRSSLYREGLLNYFADDLVRLDTRITWLQPPLADQLLRTLDSSAPLAVHQPHYNVIARFDSGRYQNSTSWVLDVLMAAQLQTPPDRQRAQSLARAQAFQPDPIQIAYSRRLLGGLFAANASFSDHPVSTRLSGRYPVVTVNGILRHLQRQGQIRAEREWRDGVELSHPGPA